MKQTIGVYEAKSQLSRLLDLVAQRGERIVITRNGRAVAELGPIESDRPSSEDRQRRFKALQRVKPRKPGSLREPGESLRDLAHEGHRR